MRNALELHFTPAPGNTVESVAADIAQGAVDAGIDTAAIDNALNGVVDAVAAQVAVAEEAAPVVQVSVETPVAPVEAPDVQIPTPVATPVARGTSKGLKIEKNRPMQNGVKMPSEGGMCRAVWDYLQAECDAGREVSAKLVKAHAVQVGWNTNNASIEFYNWRKFCGISGRSPK
jgi:hypothetical protein